MLNMSTIIFFEAERGNYREYYRCESPKNIDGR